MADEGLTIAVRVADLAIDEEGKVSIANPDVARLVAAVSTATTPTTLEATNNCYGGNCASGCGVKPK